MEVEHEYWQDVVKLENSVHGFRDRFMLYLVTKGHLKADEQLYSLDEKKLYQLLELPEHRLKRIVVDEFRTDEEAAKEKSEKQERERDQAIERALKRYDEAVPVEFSNLTVKQSPRPRQYKKVMGWLTETAEGAKRNLLLTGPSGTGKTAATWALLEQSLCEQEIREFEFVKTTTFLRLAKSKHLGKEENQEFKELFNRMIKTPALVLDDLGSEIISPGSSETVFELLDRRTEDWRFTAITSNCTVAELSKAFGGNADKIRRRLNQFFFTVNFDKP